MVAANLKQAADKCKPGSRRQFITFSGKLAVGMAALQLVEGAPEGISECSPNISVLVCSPFRNQRVGTNLLKTALGYVDEFDGLAWTRVKNDNFAYQVLISNAGFKPLYDNGRHTFYSLPPKT